MNSPAQQQQQLLADTSTQMSPSSVLGKGHVDGLVRLRRGEVQVQEREREQQRLRPVQEEEGQKAGNAKGEVEVLLAPEQNSLDEADYWTRPVEWIGTVRERNVAGADIGNRLYAGKKRMFKGHKWERTRERRVGRTKMLLRDMDKRIQRFKGVRVILVFANQIFPPSPSPSPSPSFLVFLFLLTDFSFFPLVPCQGQAIAASQEEQRVEEDTEAAVLSA